MVATITKNVISTIVATTTRNTVKTKVEPIFLVVVGDSNNKHNNKLIYYVHGYKRITVIVELTLLFLIVKLTLLLIINLSIDTNKI
jgi:hypothetical protein